MKLQEAPETKINQRHTDRDREWEKVKKGGKGGWGRRWGHCVKKEGQSRTRWTKVETVRTRYK